MQKFRKISLLLNASRVRSIPLSAAVILSALCSPVWAEQEAVKTGAVVSAEPDTGYSSQETSVYALPELVVSAEPDTGYSSTHSGTALGIPIPLEDTPQSVLTIKRQVLEDQQATTLWDGLKNVSGVFSRGTNSAVSEDFVIRGFRLDPRRNYYHNGVPYYNRFAAEPGNLERVEVLKGPASILYGAIEPGGIINTITPQPSTISTRQMYLSAGSYGHMSPRFSASGPLDREGRVLYRLYGSRLTTESFRDFVEQDRWYVNPSVYWGWSQSTTLELNFELLRDERTADAGIVAILDQPASVPIDRFYGDPLYNKETMSNGAVTLRATRHWTRSLKHTSALSHYKTNWDREQMSVEATRGGVVGLPGGAGHPDSDTNLLNRAIYDNEIFYRETTMRHDLSYKQERGALRHTLLLGVALSFYKEREVLGDRVHREGTPEAADADALKIDIYDPEPYYGLTIPQDFALFRNREREETSWGMYLQDLVELGDQWVLLGGLRYDGVDFDERTNQRGSYRTHGRSNGSLSPRLGVVYKPGGGFSLYSSYSRSFRPKSGEKILNEPEDGATQITPDMVGPVDPELATQFEVGGRWTDADNRLSATLALYDLARTNVVETNPRNRIYRVQIGRQRSRGVDLDLTAQPIPQLRAIASYAYVDARVERDADRPAWEDNQLDNTPEHSASVWCNYRHTVGLAVGLGVIYTGERQGNLDNDFILDDYVRVDATVTYRLQTLRVDLSVKNLTDVGYYQNAWRRDRIMPGTPRNYLLSLGYSL